MCEKGASEVLPQFRLGAHALFHHAAGVFQLVSEARKVIGAEKFVRNMGTLWREVGRADAEEGADESGVVLRGSVDDSAAPVVAAEQDGGEGELAAELDDVVGAVLEAVVGEGGRGRGGGAAVAEAVECDAG